MRHDTKVSHPCVIPVSFTSSSNKMAKAYRYILTLIISLTFVGNSFAQTVGYSYKLLAKEGCEMKYCVAKQDTSYYIIATVTSDKMRFLSDPTMKIRTFNDEVITISGILLGNDSKTSGFLYGNFVIPITEKSSTAQFKITPQQFEELNNGVSKIRISMTPMNHERTFKKDKIGGKLYKFYQKAKAQDDDF